VQVFAEWPLVCNREKCISKTLKRLWRPISLMDAWPQLWIFPALSQQGTTACISFYFIFRKEENCHVRIVFARPGCSGCHRYYFDPRSVSLFANPLVLNIVPAVSHEADGLPYIGPD
jgi:hypothetical protein